MVATFIGDIIVGFNTEKSVGGISSYEINIINLINIELILPSQ